MYDTSTEYKAEIKKPSRSFECKVTIGDRIFYNDDIVDIVIDGNIQPSDGFVIGSTTSQTLDLTLLNKGDTIYSTNKIKVEIGLKIGDTIEYIPMGLYNIDDVKKTDYAIKFTAFDNMIKFETPYFSSLGDTPTLQQVVNELSSKTGVQFIGNLPSYTVKKLEGFTCREILGYVASICGGNAVITRDGKFTIVYPGDINYPITADNYIDYKREEVKYKIGKVTCQVKEKEILSKGSLGTDSMELLFENPWVTDSILQDIYNRLNGFSYLGYSMKWQGDLSLDVGDIITCTDVKGVVRKLPILSQKFNYTGGLTAEIGAKGESKNKNSFSSSGSMGNKVDRVVIEQALVNEALINKANIKDLEASNARIYTLEVDTGEIANLLAGNITAKNIQAEFLQVLKGWMLEGSIGDAQIKDLDVNKLNAGDIDTSKLRIVSKDGAIEITGNQILINDVTDPLKPINRITIGKIKKADGSIDYSALIRAEDGQTVMFDSKTGITNAGITSGAVKDNVIADDANIKGYKLDINSVIREVNEKGTVTISGTKIQVGNKSLDVVLSEQNNAVTEQGKTLATHESKIEANEKAIGLKVDSSTYTTDMQNVSKTLADQSGRIDITEQGIKAAVTKVEMTKAINDIEIGGRNLIADSKDEWVTTSLSSNNGYYGFYKNNCYTDLFATLVGKDVTFSFDIKVSVPGTVRFYCNNTRPKYYFDVVDFKNLNDEYRRVIYTTKIEQSDDPTWTGNSILEFWGLSDYRKVFIKNLKLEVGNKATDWTPAPEDIDAKISTAESSITQLSNQISAKVDSNGVKTIIQQNPTDVKVGFNAITPNVTMSDSGSFEIINGALTVKNNNSEVVIDGKHNMHKILVSGTVEVGLPVSNTIKENTRSIYHGLGYKPAFSAFYMPYGGGSMVLLPAFSFTENFPGDTVIGINFVIRGRADNQYLYIDVRRASNLVQTEMKGLLKYFIYKEVAF